MATMKKKTIVTPGTKVSQSTINDIKKMGMAKALALAGKNGKTAGGLASEFQEGVRRMYGAKRLEAAKSKYAPAEKPKASTASRPPVAAKTTTKPATAVAAKKSGTTDPFAKAVFGAGRAITSGKLGVSGGKTAAEIAAINKARASGVTPPKKASTGPTAASVAATNAKRMGISVAEYNKRLNAKK